MVSKKIKTASEMLATIAAEGVFEKKGEDIVQIDLRNIKNAVADFFIVCHGNSRAQVEAIADSVQMEIKKAVGLNVWKKEGFENAEWVLLDYVDVVIHIFQEANRKYYRLEELWADAGIKQLKPESVKPEGKKPGSTKPEVKKPESAKPEGTKHEGTKHEGTKPESAKPKGKKLASAKPESASPKKPKKNSSAEAS